MRRHAELLIPLALLTVWPVAGSARGEETQRTIWQGVYTEEQAARGRLDYQQSCGQCHSDNLSGGGDGEPPLVGVSFMSQWWGHNVDELFGTIAETMPFNSPGRLTGQEYIDVLSYIFKSNDVPAGQVELSINHQELKEIQITQRAGEQPEKQLK
jgi:mono/diheme cytochrome c family protein